MGAFFSFFFFFFAKPLKSYNVNLVAPCLRSEKIKLKSVNSMGCSGVRLCSQKVFDIWALFKSQSGCAGRRESN